jgi:hypothetical protein
VCISIECQLKTFSQRAARGYVAYYEISTAPAPVNISAITSLDFRAGSEPMRMIEIARMGKLLYAALKEAIFAYPTIAETLNIPFANFEPNG